VKKYIYSFIDFFFPPQCLLCRKNLISYAEGYFCKECFDGFYFNNGSLCRKCGILFSSKEGENHLCGKCITQDHYFDTARSLGIFEGSLKKAIHYFKYNDITILAEPLGELLADYGEHMLNHREYEIIIPVPLHRMRLRQRGFNQSVMLAQKVGKEWNVHVSVESLGRSKKTTPQTMLPLRERRKNVRGAFFYTGGNLSGERVLLIDDVFTTGSTVNECARTLKKHGASRVDILTLARTT
jgi:ComF family protein